MADRLTAGFNIYGDSSEAWGMLMLDYDFPTPAMRDNREVVPFRNGSYDFSFINGGMYYDDREVTFTMEVLEVDWQERSNYKLELNQWLLGKPASVLTTEVYENYEFFGRCTDIKFENIAYGWKITITFTCDPQITNIITGEKVV